MKGQCPDGTPPPCAARPGSNSVAVLVFANRARDSSLSLLAEGLADQITTDLGQVRRLDVLSSASVRTVLARGSRDPRRVGEELGTRWLVDGALLPGTARVAINVQLVESAIGRVRWSATYQRPTEDLFGLIASVSDSVARAIVGELDPAERAALAARPTRSAAAYDAFVRAQALGRRGGFYDLRHAVTGYEDAIAADSGFAAAWAGLAWVWMYHDAFYPPRVVYPRAREAADHALAIDSTLGSALIARSMVATWFEYDYGWGERLARTVLARDPGNARAHLAHAFALLGLGRTGEAAAAARVAQRADSLDVLLTSDVAIILMAAGRPAEADTAIRVARDASGDSLLLGWLESEVLLTTGRCGPSVSGVVGILGTACRSGPAAARPGVDSIAAAVTRGDGAYVGAHALAAYYAATGDREATLHWLARALEQRGFLGLIARHPLFAFVRDDPRFQALLRAANIPVPAGN
ncbi:MAG TPA: hypothetical protein VMF70_14485 [Gemmatimonadales bacterium]|nr:hypothetical protein [Gemmatimonadales bacterium]